MGSWWWSSLLETEEEIDAGCVYQQRWMSAAGWLVGAVQFGNSRTNDELVFDDFDGPSVALAGRIWGGAYSLLCSGW